jgi:pimeloyl-ACP methyl ester carboxylesterase
MLAAVAYASYSCVEFDVPLSFDAPHAPALFPPFQDHYQSVAFLNGVTSRTATLGASPFGAPENITVDVTIAAFYCTPVGKKPTTVQVLTHGLGFDHSYWDFGGPRSEYNYIESATAAGYATLSYDRMGNGKSTIKNPYNVQQLGTETGVVIALTTLLRSGGLSKPAGHKIPVPKTVVHVGHSFGSSITQTLAATAPSLSDGIVLTGYSGTGGGVNLFAASSNFHIAKENDPQRLAAYKSNGWLTWGDELANQYSFFHYPNFDPEVLAKAEATKWPFAVGEPLTSVYEQADGWTKPLMVSCDDTMACEE